jgi:hypothetical protein
MFWNRKSESEWSGPEDCVNPEPPQKTPPRQYYSVGRAEGDKIALTLYPDNAPSVTSYMNAVACRQLIRSLEAALGDDSVDTTNPVD